MLVVVGLPQQLVDVDLSVLAALAVDVGGRRALAALGVARPAQTALCQRRVQRLEVAGRVNQGAVGDAVSLDGPVRPADTARRAVRRAFVALLIAASTAF